MEVDILMLLVNYDRFLSPKTMSLAAELLSYRYYYYLQSINMRNSLAKVANMKQLNIVPFTIIDYSTAHLKMLFQLQSYITVRR